MSHLGQPVAMVSATILVVLAATVALVAIILARRFWGERHQQHLGDVRKHFGPLLASVLAGEMDYDLGRNVLEVIARVNGAHVLEEFLLEREPKPHQVAILRRLCEDLGLVEVWQRQLGAPFQAASLGVGLARSEAVLAHLGHLGFLIQAASAHKLGVIRHLPSWPLLAKALGDDQPDLGTEAAESLAEIGDPSVFVALLDQLYSVVQNSCSYPSLPSIKAALMEFPLEQASNLVPALLHSDGRIRFEAADTIRGMVKSRASQDEHFLLHDKMFPPQLTDIFLGHLCRDDNPDVRARVAAVIAYLPDWGATPALLTLLEDREWFVRLQTLRALARPEFGDLEKFVTARLTDSHWMVREAAAHTLRSFGRAGLEQLVKQLLTSNDRYCKEQIAEELQRIGLLPALLARSSNAPRELEIGIIRQFEILGKTSDVRAYFTCSPDGSLHQRILANSDAFRDPQIRSWVESLASRTSDIAQDRDEETVMIGAPGMIGRAWASWV